LPVAHSNKYLAKPNKNNTTVAAMRARRVAMSDPSQTKIANSCAACGVARRRGTSCRSTTNAIPISFGVEMSTAKEYERQAEDCLAAARGAEDNTERTMLMRLYEQWSELAAYKRSKETNQSPKM